MNKEVTLKPCPFCGGEAYFRTFTPLKGTAFLVGGVECRKSGAAPWAITVSLSWSDEEKRKAVAERWNRRAQ